MKKRIGVLALQGDYLLHQQTLEKIKQNGILVRTKEELKSCDALIIPGGESTTIRKLALENGLFDAIKNFGKEKPLMGTCAGLILLAKEVSDSKAEETLALLDIAVKRTAYGRQIHSFVQVGKVNLQNGNPNFEMVFIRAPKIVNVGKTVERIGFCDDEVVVVRDRNLLGLSFHPELTADTRIHQYFVNQFLN
ncbi:MAG: Pyridoxal 5'-phosphate synthase, glutaminase subunit Pdx2 [candidate division Zixibacteria bacterium RBG-1]|nr:MAG: Pyridoxal 5'-phosphate synthase, glutaminase subunit Pdx2 [candidate division Zixibacteria bacterium RBG-1]OGC85832.1 MAG: glutamine amidotransferase subunit PdxT [candidate division Zixibacteria bacterium RBG_19FT_COMBO_42_43]